MTYDLRPTIYSPGSSTRGGLANAGCLVCVRQLRGLGRMRCLGKLGEAWGVFDDISSINEVWIFVLAGEGSGRSIFFLLEWAWNGSGMGQKYGFGVPCTVRKCVFVCLERCSNGVFACLERCGSVFMWGWRGVETVVSRGLECVLMGWGRRASVCQDLVCVVFAVVWRGGSGLEVGWK